MDDVIIIIIAVVTSAQCILVENDAFSLKPKRAISVLDYVSNYFIFQSWAVGVFVLVYFSKIVSLPAPLLYCVFDRFILLHKIPNICRFYPYFSMLFQFSICQLFCFPNSITAEPEYYRCAAKAKERMGGKALSGYCLKLVRSLGRANSIFGSWRVPTTQIMQIWNSNKVFGFSTETNHRHKCLLIFSRKVILFLRGKHNFKIQLPLYFQQPDWLSWSFPSNLITTSHPFFLWLLLRVCSILVQQSSH